ncbi:MAG: 7TM-DISM domain-containing protein [Deltaproteobacteria bacterium]|nr:7TM-DISM domain-containing protein [Deltaproteobacteria bacterium]
MYNLFLFLSVKDRNYLFYVLYILGITGMHASFNGFTFQYLWPAYPWWANQSTLFFIEFMQFNMALFTRSFLKARENTPRLDAILIFFTAEKP